MSRRECTKIAVVFKMQLCLLYNLFLFLLGNFLVSKGYCFVYLVISDYWSCMIILLLSSLPCWLSS